MSTELLKERFVEVERLALAADLRPYDVHFFEVPSPVIWQTASYGLPTRYSHWSFGRVYQHQKTQGEMGFARIYELILNNDPSLAFLDKRNTPTINLMIAAHCYAHSDFFANNILFQKNGETQMVDVAKRHAVIIEQFRDEYGEEAVDSWLDIALSMEHHIDIYKGYRRKPYPARTSTYKERDIKPYEDIVHIKEKEPIITKVIKGIHIPPHPERDLLWFMSEYAGLEPWQQKIFEIVRRESYYFYPQFRTKIMNEGWASYWHKELMDQYALGNYNDYGVTDIKYQLSYEEHLDFLTHHEKVVQPGVKERLKEEEPETDPLGHPTGRKVKVWSRLLRINPKAFYPITRLNPYYVGFRMFRDIKERWDEYHEQGYREDEWGSRIPVTIDGAQKIREVMMEEDDISFMRNYLTEELAHELHLFVYGNTNKYKDNYGIQEQIKKRFGDTDDDLGSHPDDEQYIQNKTVQVQSKELKYILHGFARSRNNYGVPEIVVRRVDEAGLMRLEHLQSDPINLDLAYAEQVLKYIYRVWRRPVELVRLPPPDANEEENKTWVLTYNGNAFDVDYMEPHYPEEIEDSDVPSSW